MNRILATAGKEFAGFFSSLTAFIFFGAFLAILLYVFFWADPFFARNIADVRPMFEWMPVLLIFLVPALTMRAWAEERRSGTLELLMTLPTSKLELVVGKFLACLLLVIVALCLTLPLPISVGLFAGDLDWGPIAAGYLATIFLAASYIAIGLYTSTKTDNQIVSLIMACGLCGLFLLIGEDSVTSLFGANVGEFLKLLGSGSRFQSISRGIIDFRDLYYYFSIAAVFLTLNVLALERLRWASNRTNLKHKRWLVTITLCLCNFIVANFWLQAVSWARCDVTAGQIYSISPATRFYLSSLQEPLVIRGYFSKRTHPFLSPLVPRLRDLLKEYALVGRDKVRVEFVDPLDSPSLEKEANEKYGIKPVVFQTANKYQNALTNSYFDVLVKYGDQFEKLSFRDLIEAKTMTEGNVHVDLKNPEYAITSAIKKVIYSYQAAGNPFNGIDGSVEFTAYVSGNEKLPVALINLRRQLAATTEKLRKQSQGKLIVNIVDPEREGGKIAKHLESDYGFRPMMSNPLAGTTFWFYMVLKKGDQTVVVPIPEELNQEALERSVKAGLKRFSKGFLKTIGIWLPPSPTLVRFGESRGNGIKDFVKLVNKLSNSYAVHRLNLQDGRVPADVDLLLVVAPEDFDAKAVFAIDQYLMKGATVIIAANPFKVFLQDIVTVDHAHMGLESWFKHLGITIEDKLVLDRQSFPLPIPVHRMAGGVAINETQLMPYAYFADIRRDGMSEGEAITAGIDQLTMSWASPISVDAALNKTRHLIKLLQSSPHSWTSNGLNVTPDYRISRLGFAESPDQGRKLLGVVVQGTFDSYFKDKKIPLIEDAAPAAASEAKPDPEQSAMLAGTIEKSPDSARLLLLGSASFLSDRMQLLASQTLGSDYAKPSELILNAVDWALQDRELLSIRGRGQYARPLRVMESSTQMLLEYGNYGLAFAALFVIWLVRQAALAAARRRYVDMLDEKAASQTPVSAEV